MSAARATPGAADTRLQKSNQIANDLSRPLGKINITTISPYQPSLPVTVSR